MKNTLSNSFEKEIREGDGRSEGVEKKGNRGKLWGESESAGKVGGREERWRVWGCQR